jgi:hypothetical protein
VVLLLVDINLPGVVTRLLLLLELALTSPSPVAAFPTVLVAALAANVTADPAAAVLFPSASPAAAAVDVSAGS